MRVLGFSQEWGKLKQDKFTTFRTSNIWLVGMDVQIVIKPRTKTRKKLGVATIIQIDNRPNIAYVSEEEAREDGFDSWQLMCQWLLKANGLKWSPTMPINKLTLKWVEKHEPHTD